MILLALVLLPSMVWAQFPSQNLSVPTFVVPASAVNGAGVAMSTTTAPAIQAINNSNGNALEGVVNSGTGIAVRGLSVSTTQPAIYGSSTGYYGGLFLNVTDLGNDAANANAIGLVSQSAYSNAFYAQQGEVLVSLADNNVYPATYITRVTGGLGGFDFTRPLLEVEDTTSATGGLLSLIRGGTTRFEVTKDGYTTIRTAGGTGLTNLNTGTGDVNFRMQRTGGTASDWFVYMPSGSTEFRFFSGADRITFSAAGDINLLTGFASFVEMSEPAAPAANGARLYVKDNGSGKTQLCVRFASGASQCFATEP